MPSTVPHWHFILDTDRTWRWRALDSLSAPFATRADAMENATQWGFDPLGCYWTVTINGRTTHYRPGKPVINLPAGVLPDQ